MSQEVIETLLRIYDHTGDKRYLKPIPDALQWLRSSTLPDGKLARYYELRTNRPLYMRRYGKEYHLTYDDRNLPKHYGWKWESRVQALTEAYEARLRGILPEPTLVRAQEIKTIQSELDDHGRWVSTYAGERLVGQPEFSLGQRYLSSERFANNLTKLSQYLQQTSGE